MLFDAILNLVPSHLIDKEVKKVITVEWLKAIVKERLGADLEALVEAARLDLKTMTDQINGDLTGVELGAMGREEVAAAVVFRLCHRAGAAWRELGDLSWKWFEAIDKLSPVEADVLGPVMRAVPQVPKEEKRISRGGGRFG